MKKWIVFVFAYTLYVVFGWVCFAGDTYACINAKGDYINYGPAAPVADPRVVISQIVVANDSARYEPRWSPMLSPDDLRALTFIQARNADNTLTVRLQTP